MFVGQVHEFLGDLLLEIKLADKGSAAWRRLSRKLFHLGSHRADPSRVRCSYCALEFPAHLLALVCRGAGATSCSARGSRFSCRGSRDRSVRRLRSASAASSMCARAMNPKRLNMLLRPRSSASSIRLEISTSCSRVSSGTWPICLRYIRTGSSRMSSFGSGFSSSSSSGSFLPSL